MSDVSSDSYVDVHIDKKPCLGSNLFADLPGNVLARIFAHVDAIQVAQIQLVSRQWHRVIRSTPAVWRNALYLDYGLEQPSLPALSFRLSKLASLSERKLDKVGLCFDAIVPCSPCCTGTASAYVDSMTRWLFATLREISVRVLYVFLEEYGWEEDRSDYRNAVFESLEKLSHADFESLVICFRRSDDDSDHSDISQDHPHASLLEPVGLSDDVKNRLYLDRVTFSGGLQPSSELFANLTGLHLESLRFDRKRDAQALWTLLEAMQETLQELVLNLTSAALPYTKKLGSNSEILTTLTFTKLVRFHLGYAGNSKLTGHRLYKFSCPMLESLSLNCPTPLVLFDGLLTSAVNFVRVTCRTFLYEQSVQALAKNEGLEKLFIDVRDTFSTDDQYRVLVSALHIAPQELILVFDLVGYIPDILSLVGFVESIYPFHPKAPKLGFCNVSHTRACRQTRLDELRESLSNPDKYVWMKNVRPYFAMHEREWGELYDIRKEL